MVDEERFLRDWNATHKKRCFENYRLPWKNPPDFALAFMSFATQLQDGMSAKALEVLAAFDTVFGKLKEKRPGFPRAKLKCKRLKFSGIDIVTESDQVYLIRPSKECWRWLRVVALLESR